jgi:hypothetical protein
VLPLPALAAVALSRRPPGLAVVLATIFALSLLPLGSQPIPLEQSRDFFGIHKVLSSSDQALHLYQNGGVLHGTQIQDPSLRDQPTSYYTHSGPIGDIFSHVVRSDASVAVLGLGVGGMACYREPRQSWTYFEIDPEVVRIARDPQFFTYLRDCIPDAPVVLGDARLMMSSVPDRSYDVIVVDAFSGDAPPVHLLTREAMSMYLAKLRVGGVLLYNISNSYIDFRRVLTATGQSLGLVVYDRIDVNITPQEAANGKQRSEWMVFARDGRDAGSLPTSSGWIQPTSTAADPVWTDDYSNLLSVLRLF